MVFKKPLREKATVNRTHELYRGKPFSFFKEDITLTSGFQSPWAGSGAYSEPVKCGSKWAQSITFHSRSDYIFTGVWVCG